VKHLLLAFAILASTSALAEDAPPAPQFDLSRSVTLTGHELQAYVEAQIAQARVQDAAKAIQPVSQKIRDALTVKP
jgi:hypothetical protein